MYQLKPSFAGGELAPALYGRIDLAKYDVGAAEIENMIVLRYGGVSRRPGFRYIAGTHNNGKARLLPFRYSSDQNYVVEVTAGCFRFYTEQGIVVDGGGNPYTVANDFLESELADIKYTQSADTLFLTHPDHYPMTLVRRGVANWAYQKMDIVGGPFEDAVRNGISITPAAKTGTITLTASADYFTNDMVGRFLSIQQTIASQKAEGVPGTLAVDCPPGGTVYVETFGFWSGTIHVEKWDKDSGGWVELRSQHNNHNSNYNMTFTNEEDGIVAYRVTSSDFDPSVWTGENPNQTGKVVVQTFASDYEGIVKITARNSGTSATATVVRALAAVTPTQDYALSPWSAQKGYPACCGFFEDRFVLAATKTDPQTFWMSQTGDYYNFGKSIPQVDTDAITGTLNNGQMNGIKHLATFGEVIMQTAGGTYKVSGGDKPITPTNIQSKPQEYRGINNLTPCLVGGRIVFVQQQGNIVRDLGYTYDSDKYEGDDVGSPNRQEPSLSFREGSYVKIGGVVNLEALNIQSSTCIHAPSSRAYLRNIMFKDLVLNNGKCIGSDQYSDIWIQHLYFTNISGTGVCIYDESQVFRLHIAGLHLSNVSVSLYSSLIVAASVEIPTSMIGIGTTSQRPDARAAGGRFYYDATLRKILVSNAINWIDTTTGNAI